MSKQATDKVREVTEKVQEATDQVMDKAHEAMEGTSRRTGLFALIAIVTIVGIAVWIILANSQES